MLQKISKKVIDLPPYHKEGNLNVFDEPFETAFMCGGIIR